MQFQVRSAIPLPQWPGSCKALWLSLTKILVGSRTYMSDTHLTEDERYQIYEQHVQGATLIETLVRHVALRKNLLHRHLR